MIAVCSRDRTGREQEYPMVYTKVCMAIGGSAGYPSRHMT